MTWAIYRPDEKKLKVEIELSINDNTKAIKYTPGLSFSACQIKIVEITDLTHMTYQPAIIV